MKLTFVDSGVLVAAFRAKGRESNPALAILDDPQRSFASSIFVKLEVAPKATFLRRRDEVEFYEEFFRGVSKWALVGRDLTDHALEIASNAGLAAMDALHLAAAHQTRCEELVTTEKPSKPIHRTSLMAIRTIHP
jgi:predicted nucleic acid-binding protein